MSTPHKYTRIRRWATGLLLAAYGSAGVLGYGLHSVWECEHHCHVHSASDGAVHPHDHGHCCHHHHDHEPVIVDGRNNSTTYELVVDDCPICEFLVQAQTPFVIELSTAYVGPALSVPAPLDCSYVVPLPGVPSARGPPLG